ncbi:ArsR/SmtB family transcription factor [Acinetobacter equi]|uniref:ArsR family transcriptional regulator n=1 Tax=Acinetobacter equi TaxID=1324350 RepID=A0A0N9W313_9GAMM|nr:metalloregulator ArsR/SmtB family transcription factor [Acinetobacter equi]ALH96010.1 ArsR family transcriptional regulator [Acinetobacter equi]
MNEDFKISSVQNSAEKVVGILKSLANTDRLIILCFLSKQELNVAEIEQLTKINQPTLSQQLMMLRKSDVVSTRRDGKQIFYSIKDKSVLQILQTLHDLYCNN